MTVCWPCFKHREDIVPFKYFDGTFSQWLQTLCQCHSARSANTRERTTSGNSRGFAGALPDATLCLHEIHPAYRPTRSGEQNHRAGVEEETVGKIGAALSLPRRT